MKLTNLYEGNYHSVKDIPGYPFDDRFSGNFRCNDQNLQTLEGSPTIINGEFVCANSKITTLEGGPRSVSKGFYCQYCELTSLEGSPTIIKGSFYCHHNHLKSVKSDLQEVVGDFNCSSNEITSLNGLPKIYGNIDCSFNNITSLIGIDDDIEEMRSNFYCTNNPIREGGLGLLLVKNLILLLHNTAALKIIDKYIGRPELIYDCQAELIENGFEAFAQL